MGFCFAVILFGYLCFAGKDNLVNGFCAYPCFMQNRSFQYMDDQPEERVVFNGSIKSKYENGELTNTFECVMRSGPFIMSRTEIPGNDTHATYTCDKYILDEKSGAITVYYTNYVLLKNFPSICAVCNSTTLREAESSPRVMKDENLDCSVVIRPKLGCNTPKTCYVTNSTTQSQCPCDSDPFDSDSGFCCS